MSDIFSCENTAAIACALEEDISDDDNLEYDSVEDEYDSDADPEYIPDENEQNNDDCIVNIEEIEGLQNKERKRKPLLNKPSTSKSQPAKRSKISVTNQGNDVITTTNKPDIVIPLCDTMVGKDDFTWDTKSKEHGRKALARNIIHISSGPTAEARDKTDPLECFKVFFTPDIIAKITIHTNEEISRNRTKYADPDHYSLRDVDSEEIEAFLGILILTAALKDNHLPIKLLFNSDYCGDRYRATMTERRFQFLIVCLRFDNKQTREERKKETKLAPISEIWDIFVQNCISSYRSSSYVTIDEQLIGFRGKCPFRMYIPNKPNKYGIKLVMMCDNSTKYMLNAIPYLGKGTVTNNQPVADYFVQKLVGPTISGSNKNVTMDNWFSSIPLAKHLLEECKVTMVGTIKKNKRELPIDFKDPKYCNRSVGSSLFLFHEEITALSYKPKTNKIVTLISTMHPDGSVNEDSKKPEMILSYNATKGSVDTFDQMCQNMNCGRKTARWPLCFFYNMINIASINAYIVYVHNSYRAGKNKPEIYTRMDFMIDVHKKLTANLQRSRLEHRALSGGLKKCIVRAVGGEDRADVAENQQGPRK